MGVDKYGLPDDRPIRMGKYNPKNKDLANNMETALGKSFKWKFVYELYDINYYEADDINFPSSSPVKEEDIDFDT